MCVSSKCPSETAAASLGTPHWEPLLQGSQLQGELPKELVPSLASEVDSVWAGLPRVPAQQKHSCECLGDVWGRLLLSVFGSPDVIEWEGAEVVLGMRKSCPFQNSAVSIPPRNIKIHYLISPQHALIFPLVCLSSCTFFLQNLSTNGAKQTKSKPLPHSFQFLPGQDAISSGTHLL